MRQFRLAVLILPALVLAACSSGNNAPASSSSTVADNTAPTPPPAVSSEALAAPVKTGTPANAKDLKPLLGTWGLDPANCGDQVLKISAKRFEGPGSGCDITGFSDNGDGTYTASMSCTAGGQTSNERINMRPIFAPTGEGIDLIYLDRNNLKSEVLRCDAQ
jgi:hypothetical protein